MHAYTVAALPAAVLDGRGKVLVGVDDGGRSTEFAVSNTWPDGIDPDWRSGWTRLTVRPEGADRWPNEGFEYRFDLPG